MGQWITGEARYDGKATIITRGNFAKYFLGPVNLLQPCGCRVSREFGMAKEGEFSDEWVEIQSTTNHLDVIVQGRTIHSKGINLSVGGENSRMTRNICVRKTRGVPTSSA
ncbi:hypothetical protein PILCRDRAFT_817429 [Piloderma croceum F 1598]|uniref:Uncharacterized protein n=1 Tax=Piloderma croceum (strain F 1598) TaxID=765440 RepID=A0A0C3FMR3_PILCF|nr:hypothetical protein PILCRDRAFT_817429 [Piloderma croceum F 1598]